MGALEAYNRQVSQATVPSAEEQLELLRRWHCCKGEAQRDVTEELLLRNQRLVLKQAFRFLRRGERAGLTILDLIQEGSIGLMIAIEKYEEGHNTVLSTYATLWIRQAMRRAIADSGALAAYRIPVHVHETISVVETAKGLWAKENGGEPTPLQVFETVQRMGQERKWKKTYSLRQVGRALKLLNRSVYSLDQPVSEENDSTHYNFVPVRQAGADSVAEAKQQLSPIEEVYNRVEEATNKLPPRTCEVISLRLGLFGKPELTLEEIGQRYELTRERIRQIEERGLEAVSTEVGFTADEIRELLRMRSHLLEYLTAA